MRLLGFCEVQNQEKEQNGDSNDGLDNEYIGKVSQDRCVELLVEECG